MRLGNARWALKEEVRRGQMQRLFGVCPIWEIFKVFNFMAVIYGDEISSPTQTPRVGPTPVFSNSHNNVSYVPYSEK